MKETAERKILEKINCTEMALTNDAFETIDQTALIKVHNDIMYAFARCCVVALAMLHMTAAFETIDHAILVSRLFHRFGVTGAALEWFRSYLSDRHQVV